MGSVLILRQIFSKTAKISWLPYPYLFERNAVRDEYLKNRFGMTTIVCRSPIGSLSANLTRPPALPVSLIAVVRIRIQHFKWFRIQGFDDQKIYKKIHLKKFLSSFFWSKIASLGLLKKRPSYRRTFNPQKEYPSLKEWFIDFLLFLWVIFALLDLNLKTLGQVHTVPLMRIRIQPTKIKNQSGNTGSVQGTNGTRGYRT